MFSQDWSYTIIFCQHGCDTSDHSRCGNVTTISSVGCSVTVTHWVTDTTTEPQKLKLWLKSFKNYTVRRTELSAYLATHQKNRATFQILSPKWPHSELKQIKRQSQQVLKAFVTREADFLPLLSVIRCLNLCGEEENMRGVHGKTPKQLLPSSFLLPHFLQSKVHPEKTVSRGGNASAVSQQKTSSSFGQGTERDRAAENCKTKRKPANCE